MEPVTKAERGRRPSAQDKKAGAHLKQASSREPDKDLFVSREVSGSNPLPIQAVATRGGEQRLMPPFGDKPTTHHLELAPAREQGPEDLAGRSGAVLPAVTVEEQVPEGADLHDTFLQQLIAPTPLVKDEQQELTVKEGQHEAQPGAYPVESHARNDATRECHHRHKTTLSYMFFDCDKMPNHSVCRFVVFLWLLCGAFAQQRPRGLRQAYVSISS